MTKEHNLKDFPPAPTGKQGWPWSSNDEYPQYESKDNNWPKVSIVMPSYNQGKFIEESIRSVLLQGYPNLEFIIIDAKSTDNSVEVIRKYEKFLTHWVSEPDKGQSNAINKGLKKCTGKLFNWHNSDDILTQNSIFSAVSAFKKYPDISFVHGYRIEINENSNSKKSVGENKDKNLKFTPGVSEALKNLKTGCQPGCLMRRSLVTKNGGIDENLHYVMDMDIHLRILLDSPCLYINTPLVFYRIHENIKSCEYSLERAKERLLIADKLIKNNKIPQNLTKVKWTMLASAHIFAANIMNKGGYFTLSLLHLFKAFFILPYWNLSKRKDILSQFKKIISEKLRKNKL
ncbi:MAG TPA: glycosyltransferase family 2 protein [Victivallales bacterium]|nr:glycosyltransferase family 2 protein [Victivallales bacterium]